MSGWRWVGSSCGQRPVHDLHLAAHDPAHPLGQLLDGELDRVAEVHRLVPPVGGHQADQPFDQVVHVAEAAGLLPVAVEGQLLPRSAWTMKLETTRPSPSCIRVP